MLLELPSSPYHHKHHFISYLPPHFYFLVSSHHFRWLLVSSHHCLYFLVSLSIRVRVLVPGEGLTRPLTPVGVRVRVPGEGRMVAHARSCSSSR